MAAITAFKSFWGLGIFCHSSLEILSSSVRLDGDRQWTAIFRSLQRCSIGFKSLFLFCVALAICLESLSCWKVNLLSNLRFRMLWISFSLRLSIYFGALRFSSTLTSPPVPAAEKHLHRMRLIPAQLTFGMVLCRCWVELVSSKMMLRIEVHQTRESCFSESEDPLDAVWQIPCVFDRGEDWVWPHCQKAQIGDVCPFVGFSYQHIWSWSLTRVTWVLGYLSRHGPSPFISQNGLGDQLLDDSWLCQTSSIWELWKHNFFYSLP